MFSFLVFSIVALVVVIIYVIVFYTLFSVLYFYNIILIFPLLSVQSISTFLFFNNCNKIYINLISQQRKFPAEWFYYILFYSYVVSFDMEFNGPFCKVCVLASKGKTNVVRLQGETYRYTWKRLKICSMINVMMIIITK